MAYIAHPVEPRVYIPVADFHRFLIEHKAAEALRITRSLSAVTIEVSRVEGWDQSIGVNLGVAIPAAPNRRRCFGKPRAREGAHGSVDYAAQPGAPATASGESGLVAA